MMTAEASRALDEQLAALRGTVALLRGMGLEILSAQVCPRSSASVHVVEPGALAHLPGVYVRCVLDRSTHRAVPFGGCDVIWIDPAPVAGQPPAPFTSLEIA